jgi:hypothetical protein
MTDKVQTPVILSVIGKRPLGRPRRRWVDNIEMNLREVEWDGMDWIDLAQGPVEGLCERGHEPPGSIKCWDVLEELHNCQVLKKGSAP